MFHAHDAVKARQSELKYRYDAAETHFICTVKCSLNSFYIFALFLKIDHFSDMKTKARKHTFGHISTPVLYTVRSWRAPTLAFASVFAALTIAMAGPSLPEPRIMLLAY